LANIERTFRSVHGWLGVIVLPWIFVIGLTGIYLNHSGAIYRMLPNGTFDESSMDTWPGTATVSEKNFYEIVNSFWPKEKIGDITKEKYHKRDAIVVKKSSGRIIVDELTGFYWVKTRYIRKTFSPDGELVNRKLYWGRVFKTLHTDGWLNGGLGSWLADITAGSMAIFALTGMVLFFSPRWRKRRNKQARLRQARARTAA